MEPGAVWVVVAAGGSGRRMQAGVPKQYLELAGKSILEHTLDSIQQWTQAGQVVLVTPHQDQVLETLSHPLMNRLHEVDGGESRAASVLKGLEYISRQQGNDDWVMVHDAARPFARRRDVQNLCIQVVSTRSNGGLLAVPVSDTLKLSDSHRRIKQTVSRVQMWQAQTPQIFRVKPLLMALETARASGLDVTDEASAMEHAGADVLLVEGSPDNIKITHPEDLERAEFIIQQRGAD